MVPWNKPEKHDLDLRVHGELEPLKRHKEEQRTKQPVKYFKTVWTEVKTHWYKQQLRLLYLLNINFDGPVVILIQGFEGTWFRTGIKLPSQSFLSH